MRSIFASSAVGAIALAALGATSALAAQITFVSGKGVDQGTCASPATPCRSFGYALSQTSANGEIKTLDPAHYGFMTINKSVTITGVPGAGVSMAAAGTAITINNAAAVVNLRGLEINGRGVGTRGITVVKAKAVNIVDCTVRRFGADGISISPESGSVSATISNTISSDNGNFGIEFVPGSGAAVFATVDHMTTNNNAFAGVLVSPGATAMISDSVANSNAIDGFRASGDSTSKMYLARSVASGNGTGIHNVTSATVKSFGDNKVFGNGVEVDGTVGTVPSK